jgi:hypothetical protein
VRALASAVSLALICLVTGEARAQQSPCLGACVHIGTSIASVSGTQSEVLNSQLSSLSGANVGLTQAQYQTLLSSTVDLQDLEASLESNGLADSPQAALSNQLSVSQVTDAIADSLRGSGNTMAADAVAALSMQTMNATGTLQLGKLLGGNTASTKLTGGNVNTLDLINGVVQTSNLNSDSPAKPTNTTGSALGLGGMVGGVTITVVALDQPMFVCGPQGTQFYSGAVRVRIHADISNSTTPLNLGVLAIALKLGSVDLVVSVGRATGTIKTVDAITAAVTVEVTPGIAELYLGKVSDAALADRDTPLTLASNVDYATIASVTITGALNLNASATIDAKGYALGTQPSPITLMFQKPYPQTKSATTNPAAASQLLQTLLSSLDIRVNPFVGPLSLGGALSGVTTLLTNTLKMTGGALDGVLSPLLSGTIEPLLNQLGIGLGRADVTVDSPFLVGNACSDGSNCTTDDVCTDLGTCAGKPVTCTQDAFTCTTDACNTTTGQCENTVSSGCLIGNMCIGAGTTRSGFPCQVCNPTLSKTAWSNQTLNTPCSDGLFCTQNDACNGSGVCTGPARSCTDNIGCTADTCNENADRCDHVSNPSDGCVIGGSCYPRFTRNPSNNCEWCDSALSATDWVNVTSGEGCTDSSLCTTNEQCNGSGECIGTPVDCGMGNACMAGICNENTGACGAATQGCSINGTCYASGASHPTNPCLYCAPGTSMSTWTPRPSNYGCSDGQFCTVNDTCNGAGLCQPGAPRTCTNSSGCGAGVCNETTDRCDTASTSGCVIDSVCYASGFINPADPCQVCNPVLAPNGWTARGSGASCSDGAFCTVNDTCNESGQCVGQPRACGSGGGCQASTCNEYNDTCETNVSAGGCFIDGGCYVGGQINPGNPCQYCGPSVSTIYWSNRAYGSYCSDGYYCTVGDMCDGYGSCAWSTNNCGSGGPVCTGGNCGQPVRLCNTAALTECSIGNACWAANFINPQNGCQWCQPQISPYVWTNRAVGSDCAGIGNCYSEGATCNGQSVCLISGNSTCDDELSCTVDTCDSASGKCFHNTLEACAIDGACWAAGSDAPGNRCQTCDPEVSATRWTNKPEDAPCSGNDACSADYCDGSGECIEKALDCSDDYSCTIDSCDEDRGRCVSTTEAGHCLIEGGCYAAGDTAPNNDCWVCDPERSASEWTNRPSGTRCVNGEYCTIDRSCNDSGECEGGEPRNCNDNIDCSEDTCDEDAKQCRHAFPDAEGCVISGKCWAEDSINPEDDCQVCDHERAGEGWSRVQEDRCALPDAGPVPDAGRDPELFANGGLAGGSADSKCSVGARLTGNSKPNLTLWTWLFIWGLFIWRKRRD